MAATRTTTRQTPRGGFSEGYYYRQRQEEEARKKAKEYAKQIAEKEKQVALAEKEVLRIERQIQETKLKPLTKLERLRRGQQEKAVRSLQKSRLESAKQEKLTQLEPYKEKIKEAKTQITEAKKDVKGFYKSLGEYKVSEARRDLFFGKEKPIVSQTIITDIKPESITVKPSVTLVEKDQKSLKDLGKKGALFVWSGFKAIPSVPIAMPYVGKIKKQDKPIVGTDTVGMELTTLGDVGTQTLFAGKKLIQRAGQEVSKIGEVKVPSIITIDRTGKLKDIPIAWPTRAGIAALGYPFVSEKTREELKPILRESDFIQLVPVTQSGYEQQQYLYELGSGLREESIKALESDKGKLIGDLPLTTFRGAPFGKSFFEKMPEIKVSQVAPAVAGTAPSIVPWIVSPTLAGGGLVLSGIERQRPEFIQREAQRILKEQYKLTDVPEGYEKIPYLDYEKEALPELEKILKTGGQFEVGLGAAFIGVSGIMQTGKGIKWLQRQKVYSEPVYLLGKTKQYGKYGTQISVGGYQKGGRYIYPIQTTGTAKQVGFKLYGKSLTPLAGKKTILTSKWRELTGYKPIYSGVPYGSGSKGYKKALELLTKPIAKGGQFGYTTTQAKNILRYKSPTVIQQVVSAKGAYLLTPTSEKLALKDIKVRIDYLGGRKRPSLIEKGVSVGVPKTYGKVEGVQWIRYSEKGKLIKELPIYTKKDLSREFVATKLLGKYPSLIDTSVKISPKKLVMDLKKYPGGKVYAGASVAKVYGKRLPIVSDKSLRFVGKGKPLVEVVEPIFKTTKLPKIFKSSQLKPISKLTPEQAKSIVKTLKKIYGKPRSAAILKQALSSKISATPSFFTKVKQFTAQKFYGKLAAKTSAMAALAPAVIPLLKPRLAFKQTPILPLVEKELEPQRVAEIPADVLGSGAAQAPALKVSSLTAQTQVPLLGQVTSTLTRQQTQRTPALLEQIPRTITRQKDDSGSELIQKLREITRRKKSVDIVTGMKLKRQRTIYKNLPPFLALKKASEFVDRNIEASFKLIVNPKPPKQKDISKYNLSAKFRPSKRNPLFVVEKRKYRLDTFGEKQQIKSFPKKKRKKIKKKLKLV